MSHYPEANLDAIPTATPDEREAARTQIARAVLAGDLPRDTAADIAAALDLLGDNVTHLAPGGRARPRPRPRHRAVPGTRAGA